MYKAVYPWLNTSFEAWLFLYNVAYLFDRTPFYRPWLSWIGVDIRRVGIDDLVSLADSSVDESADKSRLACRPTGNEATCRRHRSSELACDITAPAPGFAPHAAQFDQRHASHCHLLCQVPGVVVLTLVAGTGTVEFATGACCACANTGEAAPAGDPAGPYGVRGVSAVWGRVRERDGGAVWLCFLLSVRV